MFRGGSYMRGVYDTVYSAGFMIYCTNSKKKEKGSVVKRTPDADNYRAEIMGEFMLQLILQAASQNRSSP